MHTRFFISAILLLPLLLPGQPAAAAPLSLTEALSIADRESSLLAAQRSAISAAEETTASARELPDPKLKFGIDNLPADGPDRYSLTRDFMTMRKIGVMQEFVRSDKREIRGRRAEQELAREQAMLGDARAALRRDVAQLWIERYFAERMAAVVDEQYAEADLQRETLQAGLRAGKTQPADLLALQVNLQSLLDRRAEYRRQAARAAALLSRWLGAESARPLAALPSRLLPAQHRELATHAENHPHLQTLERQIDIAHNDAALARAANKPDWGLEVAYAQRGPQFSNMLSVQISIDLPLFQKNRQDRRRRQAHDCNASTTACCPSPANARNWRSPPTAADRRRSLPHSKRAAAKSNSACSNCSSPPNRGALTRNYSISCRRRTSHETQHRVIDSRRARSRRRRHRRRLLVRDAAHARCDRIATSDDG